MRQAMQATKMSTVTHTSSTSNSAATNSSITRIAASSALIATSAMARRRIIVRRSKLFEPQSVHDHTFVRLDPSTARALLPRPDGRRAPAPSHDCRLPARAYIGPAVISLGSQVLIHGTKMISSKKMTIA